MRKSDGNILKSAEEKWSISIDGINDIIVSNNNGVWIAKCPEHDIYVNSNDLDTLKFFIKKAIYDHRQSSFVAMKIGSGAAMLKFKCDACAWTGDESATMQAPSPFDPAQILSGCPQCKAAECFTNACDEPGCVRDATCGFPVAGGGYRRTCGLHYAAS